MMLITGATGLSGSHIVNELARQGIRFRALVRDQRKAAALQFENVHIVEGDMLKPESLAPALDGVEKALLISTGDANLLDAQCSFIDACKSAGVRHVVKFSGDETGFDRSKFRFTHMHQQIEQYLERSGLAWTHLLPCQFMQVYLREADTVKQKGELRLPAEDISLAPIDIADIAKIAAAVMQAPRQEGKIHRMTGPEVLTMFQIAELMSAVVGRKVNYVPISPEQRRKDLLASGASPYFSDALYEQAMERLQNPHAVVHLESHREFSIEPTSFSNFLRRNSSFFR